MIRKLGPALLAVSLAAVVLSAFDLRFAVPSALAAFLAGRSMGRVVPALVAFAAAVAAGVVVVTAVPSASGGGTTVAAVAVFAGMLPWLAGLAWRASMSLVRAGWDRAEQLEREQRLIAEQARLRERARIAQDMHDALGHELSLIALRAGALKLAPGLDELHREAADELRAGTAVAVERLGEVIGVLRDSAGGPPAADGTSLTTLVDRARAAGVRVELTTDGHPPTGCLMHDHAVHGVMREALTNVAKHAPAAAVTARVGYGGDETVLEVVNPGPTRAPRSPGGQGLVGLRERVRLAGGTLEAGPRDGGWAVTARVPHVIHAKPAPPPPAEAPTRTGEQRRRARRRAGRAVLALLALPVCTFAVLTAALWGWTVHLTEATVLDARTYAALRVGQTRAEIAPLLPRRQASNPTSGPVPAGAACEHYAITRDRQDDRAGDAYQLCFEDGRLVWLGTVAE